jgi:hypothetical protein
MLAGAGSSLRRAGPCEHWIATLILPEHVVVVVVHYRGLAAYEWRHTDQISSGKVGARPKQWSPEAHPQPKKVYLVRTRIGVGVGMSPS